MQFSQRISNLIQKKIVSSSGLGAALGHGMKIQLSCLLPGTFSWTNCQLNSDGGWLYGHMKQWHIQKLIHQNPVSSWKKTFQSFKVFWIFLEVFLKHTLLQTIIDLLKYAYCIYSYYGTCLLTNFLTPHIFEFLFLFTQGSWRTRFSGQGQSADNQNWSCVCVDTVQICCL